MKGLSLALAVTLSLPAAPATAGIITLGDSLATDCYSFAQMRDHRPDAMETCSRALQDPLDVDNRAATLVNRGVVRMLHEDFAGADADFDAAIAMRPTLADAWLNKGFLRLRAGDGSGALPFLRKAMALHARRRALAFFAEGVAYEQIGDLKDAYADLTKARDLEPGWSLPAQELERYQILSH